GVKLLDGGVWAEDIASGNPNGRTAAYHMGFAEKDPETFGGEQFFQSGPVAAGRQPDTGWPALEGTLVAADSRSELAEDGAVAAQQWQIGVGGGAGDDFQIALVLQAPEGPNQIAPKTLIERQLDFFVVAGVPRRQKMN